ncbi:MAG: hypothetical protein PHV59_10735 [Victivallales bacterium]|nr:hypothetical protein [Victivallales bacterium]
MGKGLLLLCLWAMVFYPAGMAGTEPVLSQKNFFAGQESEFSLTESGLKGTVDWTLTFFGRLSLAGRTIAGNNGTVIKFTAPNLSPGIMVKGKFTLRNSFGCLTFPIFLYSQEPFTNKAAYNKLDICVWGLDQDGNWLEQLLKQHDIKFKKTDNFDNVAGSVLLISGIDFSDFSEAAEIFFPLAEAGRKIIIIAPIKGSLLLPPGGFDEFTLQRASTIHKFDKNFDLLPAVSTFSLISSGDTPAMDFGALNTGYSLCRIKHGKGKIIFCGWDIQGKLKTNPTALYLLKKLLSDD